MAAILHLRELSRLRGVLGSSMTRTHTHATVFYSFAAIRARLSVPKNEKIHSPLYHAIL
jgi:hypothetical protein